MIDDYQTGVRIIKIGSVVMEKGRVEVSLDSLIRALIRDFALYVRIDEI